MKSKKPLSKLNQGVLLALVFAVLLASVAGIAGVVYARYTNSQHAQRTVAPYDMGGARFSSNYLNGGSSKDNVKQLYVAAQDVRPGTAVTICNYQSDNPMRFNENDITYDITVRLVRYNGSGYDALTNGDLSAYSLTAYSVDVKKMGDANTYTLAYDSEHPAAAVEKVFEDCILTGGASRSDSFSIRFSAAVGENTAACFALNNPNLCVEIEAEPSDGSLPTLRGIFKVGGIRSEGASNTWEGAFVDSSANPPSDYDGFNYAVSGSGAGTFTLKWDSTKVALRDDSILELLAITGATRSGDSITFPVDSDTMPRYDLHFSKGNVSGIAWDDMNEVLTDETATQTPVQRGKAVVCYFTES